MELISLVRKKKCKEAIDLINGGSNLAYVNENGCTCLHFASSEGLSEIIVAAAQHGVDIEQRDEVKSLTALREITNQISKANMMQDGETALFKAVKHSNIESVVALVAFNATINVVNNKGQSPLDIAISKKDAAVVELLCSLGSSVTIDDWAVGGVDVDILNKEDQNIMRILINHLEREAENNYGNNAFGVCYVNPGEDISIFTDITLNTDNISTNFFLCCSKIIPEYTDVSIHLGFEDRIFSDVYEIKTWGDTPKYLELDISVPGFVDENQLVVIMPLEGSVEGNITGQSFTDGEHEEEYTEFDIKIDLTRMKTATFVVLSQLRHEEFDVTQKAVADTNDWNSEDTVLYTNVIDLTMQNKTQPAKPVNVKLPLHSLTVAVDDLIIIASHKDIPETEKDWEICPTNIKIEGNMILFSTEHFTWFAVGSKKISEQCRFRNVGCSQYRPTEIFAGLKKETDNKLTLIVEIALKNFGKKRRKYWRQKGFRLQTIEYRDDFLRRKFSDRHNKKFKEHIIFNHNKKRNYRTFYIVSEQQEPPIGDVVVVRTTKKIVEQTVIDKLENKIKPGLWSVLCNNVVKVATSTSTKVAIENGIEELVRLPIDGQLFDENQDVRVNIDDSQFIALKKIRKGNEADAVQKAFVDNVEFKPDG
ncbi:PSMD10 [Mytilus edulis]|uniref:PSMD10 n=1 Tax=Mytilus edulis TaxID=6550 RepID=A0A8S3S5N8_MYTED|nr:PSMD10 [Mytilus edulis]